jgi:hypothetical protein
LSQQPVPGTRPAKRDLERAAPGSPIWPCTRWGLPCLRACAWSGGLLPHLFTLTAPSPQRSDSGQTILCGTFRRDASRRHLPRVSHSTPTEAGGSKLRGIAPGGVRTFLLPRIASEKAILHPSRTGNTLPEDQPAGKPLKSSTTPGPKSEVDVATATGPWTPDSFLNPSRPGPCRGCSKESGHNWCSRPVPVGPGR